MTLEEELEQVTDFEVKQEDKDTCMIVTPFVDALDDNIYIIAQSMASGLIHLSDCGNTLFCRLECKDLVQSACDRYRLTLDVHEIRIYARHDELKAKVNRMISALKEINDKLRN